jgi:hypothetical protein
MDHSGCAFETLRRPTMVLYVPREAKAKLQRPSNRIAHWAGAKLKSCASCCSVASPYHISDWI